nr:tetraacyldisaccharide 4'-kinase [uncultured Holophaga sp.]
MSLLRWLTAPLAPLYGLAVKARNRGFDRRPGAIARVEVPVVSVGNLSTGGTGKTPVTLGLVEALAGLGLRAAVISRGYRGKRQVDPMSVDPDSDPAEAGDEPVLMARRLGPGRVVVGRSRHAAALRALSAVPRPDLLLMDDGFQHRALHRDVDLLLLDGVRYWGNGRMLPLGDLREPMSSAARAHALVVTRGSRADRSSVLAWWEAHGSGGPVFWVDFTIGALRRADTGMRLSPADVPGPLLAFCGLGHPEAFYADLLVAGLSWSDTRSFGDHHPVSVKELGELHAHALELGVVGLVCTEKDAVKMGPGHLVGLEIPLWIAEQTVQGLDPLTDFVVERLEMRRSSR